MKTTDLAPLPSQPSPWRQFSLWDALSATTLACGYLGIYAYYQNSFSPIKEFIAVTGGVVLGLTWLFATNRLAGWKAALLIGLALLCPCLLPSHRNPEPARRMQCSNNMKQIVLALQNYHDTYQVFPPAYFTDATGKPAHSWRVLILPYIEQKPLYDRYRFDEPWDGPNNSKLHGEIVRAYQCPSDTNPNRWETSYLAVIGKDYFFIGPTSRTMAEVTDGDALTLAMIEVKHSGIHWMEPRDLHELQMAQIVNAPHGQGICSCHSNGAMGGYVDGHVEILINSLTPKTIRALLTVAGGEVIQNN